MLTGEVSAVQGYFDRMLPFNMNMQKCVALVDMLIEHANFQMIVLRASTYTRGNFTFT